MFLFNDIKLDRTVYLYVLILQYYFFVRLSVIHVYRCIYLEKLMKTKIDIQST